MIARPSTGSRAIVLGPGELGPWREALARLERMRTYPLGRGRRFRIDHGPGYARFFRALGEPRFVLAAGGPRGLAGVVAAVRRSEGPWYLCDLKTDPGAGGRRVLGSLLGGLLEATSGFEGGAWFVSMDDSRGGVARVLPGFAAVARVGIHLGPSDHAALAGLPEAPPVDLIDRRGAKDIVLVPEERALSLVHLDVPDGAPLGSIAAAARSARALGAEAICFALDPERRDLARRGWPPDAGATAYWHHPDGAPWPGLPIRSAQI